jgi:transcriptional regulator with XRE-family HTH domain
MPRLTIDGPTLLDARRRCGLKQHELAVAARVTPSRLRKLEQGNEGARLQTLGRLAHAVGLHPSELLAWDPDDDDDRT